MGEGLRMNGGVIGASRQQEFSRKERKGRRGRGFYFSLLGDLCDLCEINVFFGLGLERRSPNLHRDLMKFDQLTVTMHDRSRALPP